MKPVLRIFFVCLFFISCIFETSNKNSADYSKTPVLFIHGHGMDSNSWKKFILEFQKKGYPKDYLFAIDILPNTIGNIEAAEKHIAPEVENFIDRVNRTVIYKKLFKNKKEKIDIVSFSMGALSARWYAAKIYPERVRTLITIGGANHGTNVSCKWVDDGSKDICPAFAELGAKNFIQNELNGHPFKPDIDETPYGIGKDSKGVNTISANDEKKIIYVSIRSKIDPWIKPEDSAILDGCGDVRIKNVQKYKLIETSPGNYLFNNFRGHEEMLEKENIIDFIYQILNIDQ